ncbi:phosphoglycerate dehydrogenase [Rhodovastum atsumiense]|uniref:2-oxoglutarate reductase n=1 Tax=Rhodovastum atsumiense TaxID=504468 RepID=A0A5M6ILF5_9PROT|nr:phosphoglycerate dehydrogenase [Rhodovastum atsumiense]KAA5608455.1 phosphoglycerate dehydrogenase [Rhodovastum atsumiense]CAH2604631.1 phosphoglycerate dehydrogenase [Rhodovastum atsumiense]
MSQSVPSIASSGQLRVLLLEGIADSATALFARAGFAHVERRAGALQGAALAEALRGVHLLGIRSRTRLDEAALAAADSLLAVGCFCIGTNQVDLRTAREQAIPVFNAPFSNTRSVAELVMGEIVMLLRRIPDRSRAAHQGGWDKSAANSWEVRGKTLGIVGYGNIGSQLAALAEAFGMRVLYHDIAIKLPRGNVQISAGLAALLAECDVVSLHVPETPDTVGLIGRDEIAAMKPGSFLINNSRGTVVDLDALATALRSGHLLGAAVDVFPVEPTGDGEKLVTPLQGLPNVILTPHIGGSTIEAQWNIGEEVARKLIDYADAGTTLGAVNFPQVQLPDRAQNARYIHVHRNVPGMLGQVNLVFSRRGLNIAAQYLQTEGDLGYVVIEAEGQAAAAEVLADLQAIEGTIRARLLH